MKLEQISFLHTSNIINDDEYVDVHTEITSQKKLSVISLFSGCGGMDLGFVGGFRYLNKYYEANPYEIVFANDIVDKACETYMHNLKHDATCLDIKDLKINDLPNSDIVIGGFPCQDFSLAGKRRGLNSSRGLLYLEMKKVIEHAKPKAFIAENVDGIRKSVNGEDTSALDVIVNDFKLMGYNVEYKALNASSYGVPQNRVRVIIIGIRDDIKKHIKYPKPTHGDYTNTPLVTAKDAIDDLWDKIDEGNIHNHTKKDYSKAKFYEGKKMQGNCQINADRPAPTIRAEHHGNIEGHYRSLNRNDSKNCEHWRRLSVRECARLQSFPDNFIFPCAASSAYKQIGNAVAPVFAWHIARAIYLSLQ